jgi:hypothetical protein
MNKYYVLHTMIFWTVTQQSGIICHLVISELCLQHRILDFANGNPVRQLCALLQHCIFRGLKRWKSFGAKSGLYSGCSRHFHPNCNKAAICQALWGLGTKWLSSLQLCEEASWWSQMPNWWGSARNCLTVVLIAVPRMFCWRHSIQP